MKKNTKVLLVAAAIGGMAIICFFSNLKSAERSSNDTRALVNEMTLSPERQQIALDELANYDNKELIELLPYLTDERPVASNDVKFINRSPKAFEKYYMTSAKRVDELLARYVCWRTMRCDPGFSEKDMREIRQNIGKVFNMCFDTGNRKYKHCS